MENNLPLHFSMFNSKVRLMNQTNSKDLTLSAQEARNLHSDIFELLNKYSMLSQRPSVAAEEKLDLNMDGGRF